MTRRQRSRIVTSAMFALLIGLYGWTWYSDGWRVAATEFAWMVGVIIVILGIVEWERRGS